MCDEIPQSIGDSGETDKQPKSPREKIIEVDGKKYWCEPKPEDAIYDPTDGHERDIDGVRYWCIPYNIAFPGRRYDQQGRKDSTDID